MRSIACILIVSVGVAVSGCGSRSDEDLQGSVKTLQESVERLGAQWQEQMDGFNSRIAALEKHQERLAAMKSDASYADETVLSSMTTLEDAVSRLERIMDTTGIEQVATNNVDPQALRDVLTEYSERRQVAQVQEDMQRRNRELHEEDQKVYGEELAALYDQARMRWDRGRRRGNDEERDQAIQTLMEKYPEANATAMVIAERAMGALFQRNTEEAEKYYDLLQRNPKFASTVTEWGVEALPTLQAQLARTYLRQNRLADADRLIDSLERTHASSYIFTVGGRGGRGFEPRWESGSRVIQRLRDERSQQR